jgi:signal peptidase I
MDKDFILEQLQQTGHTGAPQKVIRKPVKKPKGPKPLWREYLEVVIISLTAAVLLRLLVVSAYRVDSTSMEDTLLEGDYIFVNKLAYSFGEPSTGDIVIFESTIDNNRDFIKRIAAVPGQTVEIIDKVLYIDNQLGQIFPNAKNSDSKIMPAQLSMRDNFGPVQVPEGQYFVLGDNRDISQDSRHWGFVPKESLKGKTIFIYWSWEPDEAAPEWSFPYIHNVFSFSWYFLTEFPSHTRWERLLTSL